MYDKYMISITVKMLTVQRETERMLWMEEQTTSIYLVGHAESIQGRMNHLWSSNIISTN
jgi:hypothetical protein